MKEEHRKDVGQRVKEFRNQLGLTQAGMVEFLDIGRANYSRIEKGEIFPGLSILKTFQDKFGLNQNWVINNKGGMLLPTDEDSRFKFGQYEPEVEDLLVYMEKVPSLKHAVLSLFHEYKVRNNDIIQAVFKQPEDTNKKVGKSSSQKKDR